MELSDLLNRGIAAARTGHREQARQLLAQVVRTDPRHEYGWLWLSTVVDDFNQTLDCLERVLTINPANSQAAERIETLKVVKLLQVDAKAPKAKVIGGDLRLGDLLVKRNIISQAALDAALRVQQHMTHVSDREPLGTILLRQGTITAGQLAQAIEEQLSSTMHGTIDDGVFRQVGHYLVKYGYLSTAQLAQTIARQTLMAQRGKHVKIGELLLKDRMLRRDQLDAALKAQQQDYDRQFGTERDKLW